MPQNTPEEFVDGEQQRRHPAALYLVGNGDRRPSLLPAHDEGPAEDADSTIERRSRPSGRPDDSMGRHRRRSQSRGNGTSRSGRSDRSSVSGNHHILHPSRHNIVPALDLSAPTAQSGYDADSAHNSDTGHNHHEYAFSPPANRRRSGSSPAAADDIDIPPFPLLQPLDATDDLWSQTQPVLETSRAPSPPTSVDDAQQQQQEQRSRSPEAPPSPERAVVRRDGSRRTRAKTPKLDWHALEYVGSYDENLDCPICRAPLVRPEITTCFHIFCHTCLAKTLEHGGHRCPIDRNPIQYFATPAGPVPARPAPPVVANQLDNLVVRCPNARCDHTCARARIAHHYAHECPFTLVPCPDRSCGKLVARRDCEEGSVAGGSAGTGAGAGAGTGAGAGAGAGTGICLHKAVACGYCGQHVELAALDDHYDTACRQKELLCAHCLAAVPRHRHGAHVAHCPERPRACAYQAAGCAFTATPRAFGDHERTCLYGMVLRLNRAHRADMGSMETLLQDSQDRVRKLELAMAGRPPVPVNPAAPTAPASTGPPPPPPAVPMPFADDPPAPPPDTFLSGDYDSVFPATAPPASTVRSTAAGPAAHSNDDTNGEDRVNRIVAYIDIFDAKVENLERYLGDVDARQAQLLMNELGPLKDQILELRNSMGHISMYVRWLMESVRQTTKRSVGLGGGGSVGGSGSGSGSGSNSNNNNTAGVGNSDAAASGRPATAATATRPAAAAVPLGRSPSINLASLPIRRTSDRENPPRL